MTDHHLLGLISIQLALITVLLAAILWKVPRK